MAKRTYDMSAAQGDELYHSVELTRTPDDKPCQIVATTSLRKLVVLEPGNMGGAEFAALWAQLDTLTEQQKQEQN